VYRAILRTTAVLSVVLASVTSARAASRVFVDVPRAGSTQPSSFIIGGWMLDFAATRDNGVSGMHVWAYSNAGLPSIFVGEITRGARPDVGAAFGKQFTQSGYSILVRNLPPGSYTMVLTPWSTVLGGFDYPAAVFFPINVSSGAAPVAMPPPSAPADASGTVERRQGAAPPPVEHPSRRLRNRRRLQPGSRGHVGGADESRRHHLQ